MKPAYNAGVIGDNRYIVLVFLRILTALLETLPEEANCNKAAFIYVVHMYFNDVVLRGFPFKNVYFNHETNPRGVCYV